MKRIRLFSQRFAVVTVAVAAVLVATISPAWAEANGGAFGLQASGSLLNIAPTATSTFPPGGLDEVLNLNVADLLSTGVLSAETTGDDNAGTSTATGTVNNLNVGLPVGIGALSLSATTIQATCTGNPDGTNTGSATLESASLNVLGIPISIPVNPGPNTNVIPAALSSLLTLVLNEQVEQPDGSLTVNAIHLTILGGFVDLVVGHASCGPNAEEVPIPMVATPIAIGVGSLAVLGVGGYMIRRRYRGREAVVDAG